MMLRTTFLGLLGASIVSAQTSCSSQSSITPKYPAPSVAAGYHANIVANGLSTPRGIIFDSSGNLLVVQPGKGIVALTFNDGGGSCLSVKSTTSVVNETTLTHGIQLSSDSKTLFASSADVAFSWSYDPSTISTTSKATVLVNGMTNADHVSRTLHISKKEPELLLISRGSASNLDPIAGDLNSGHSQIRIFNLSSPGAPWTYSSSGTMLGWGLRNSVGIAEHPMTGGIYSVENGADQLERLGVDFHQNNPGEELNFHGNISDTQNKYLGQNYGYPSCFAVWKPDEIPDGTGLAVGQQFAIDNLTSTNSDAVCARTTIPPRLTFPAHWAPLDMKFNSKGSVAYITAHGSWNRDPPDGYLLLAVPFSSTSGEPTPAINSNSSWEPILSNHDNTQCPGSCFRPVALAWDSKGRLFMSSDSTGEIYVITASDGGSVDAISTVNATGTQTASPTTSATKTAGTVSTAVNNNIQWAVSMVLVLAASFVIGLT
jgi:glucose/arabinose dehydrogenase